MTGSVELGFFGKIPARGDFVRGGLPSSFVNPWDSWLQSVMPQSQALLGDGWLQAWLEAPVWRFVIGSGICGPAAVLGVFMPSVDRVGRHFPLTCVRLGPDSVGLAATGAGFLEAAEAAGMAALSDDIEPDQLMAMLRAASLNAAVDHMASISAGGCLWWTAGSPLVSATAFAIPELPDGARFTRMLDDTRKNLPELATVEISAPSRPGPDPFGAEYPPQNDLANRCVKRNEE